MTTTLEEIIRELNQYKDRQHVSTGTQVVTVERETGEIRDEPPMFNLFKKLRFYEINRSKVVFDVKGPEISVNYPNSSFALTIRITYNARVSEKGIFSLVRAVYRSDDPAIAINSIIRQAASAFIFDRKDFVSEFTNYKKPLEQLITDIGLKCGLILQPDVQPNINTSDTDTEQFINYAYKVNARTKDAQVVEIEHSLALTLIDPIKLKLSGIKDIRAWARTNLEKLTNNAIIDMTYADVLVNMQQSVIRQPMQDASRQIGYELKQLITVPGLDIEKFYFETMDGTPAATADYATRDPRLRISLNIIIDGRLNIHNEKTKSYIKPGFDIIAGMKRNTVEFARVYINDITPDECFTNQFAFEDNIIKHIRVKLENTYGFKELGVIIKFLETDLMKRLSLLKERARKVEILADWTERKYALWFLVDDIAREGWYRFRATNYQTTAEELDDIARMVKNGMEAAILRTGEEITGKIIQREFASIRSRVRTDFGLEIKIHDFTEDLSDEEMLYIKSKKDELDERYVRTKMIQQGETSELDSYLKKREEAIASEETEEEIQKIDQKIAAIKNKNGSSKSRFLQQKTDNQFLLPGNTSEKDTNEKSSSDSSKD